VYFGVQQSPIANRRLISMQRIPTLSNVIRLPAICAQIIHLKPGLPSTLMAHDLTHLK
jgi:hypothetical protein